MIIDLVKLTNYDLFHKQYKLTMEQSINQMKHFKIMVLISILFESEIFTVEACYVKPICSYYCPKNDHK